MYNKSIIAPVIAVVFLVVSAITGVSVDSDVQTQVTAIAGDVVAVGITLWGIFKNHKKGGV